MPLVLFAQARAEDLDTSASTITGLEIRRLRRWTLG